MRTTDTDEKAYSDALSFLHDHQKMVLTVLDESGYPNSSLVLYACDDEFNFYIGTCEAFGKCGAMCANSHISLAVVEESIDAQRVFDAQGIAEQIESSRVAERLAWFTSKNTSKFYIKDRPDFVMFKITPTKMRWVHIKNGEVVMHDIS